MRRRPSASRSRPSKVEPRENLEVFTAAHPRPNDSVDAAGLDALLKEKVRRQLDALWPQDAASLERFRRTMTPALSYLLGTEGPRPDEIEAATTPAAATAGSFSTVSVGPRGLPARDRASGVRTCRREAPAALVITATALETESLLQGIAARRTSLLRPAAAAARARDGVGRR